MEIKQFKKEVKTYVSTGIIPEGYSKDEFIDQIHDVNVNYLKEFRQSIEKTIRSCNASPQITLDNIAPRIVDFFKCNNDKAKLQRAKEFLQYIPKFEDEKAKLKPGM